MSKEADDALQTTGIETAVKEPPAQLATLARNTIVRSLTNPRTHFDEAYIKELAGSIREHGLLQPILVRPLPGARVQATAEDRAAGEPLPTHEIVCGECRWRAAGLADVAEMPVLIRHLDDLQVLQVQLVENLKRRDLHPLEEAEGFDRLIKDHGLKVEDIAARVDKSASQIYVTLKLLELTPECRKLLYAGNLTRSTALLVARSPAYLQVQIAKDIMEDGFDDEPMSYRQAVRHIHQHYMLQLANAVFDIKDASLVTKAGSCTTCAKNTGANGDMFDDVKGGDTCTDPKCFDSKKLAHFTKVATAALAKGQTVIQGKEAKEIWLHEHSGPQGYKLLDDKDYIEGRYTSLRSAIGKGNVPTPVLIISPHTNAPVEALPIAVANKLLKQHAAKKPANREPSEHDLEMQFAETWQGLAVERIHGAAMAGQSAGITVSLARRIALHYLDSAFAEAEARFVRLFNVPAAKVATHAAIREFIKTCDEALVGPALLVLIAEQDCEDGSSKCEVLELIARQAGVDVQALQDQVKVDMKVAAEARVAEGDTKAPKVKTPVKALGKKGTASFMRPLTCTPALQAIVGTEPMPRTEIVAKLWAYIKKNKLQDTTNKRMVNADEKLKTIFGRDQVSMFEMAGLIGKSVSDGIAPAEPPPSPARPMKSKKTTASEAKAGISKALQEGEVEAPAAWPFPTTPKKPSRAGARA